MQITMQLRRLLQPTVKTAFLRNVMRSAVKSSDSSTEQLPKLTLFTKEDCSLCDEAMDVLKPHLSQVRFEEVDITEAGNEEYYKKYRYDIPVFHLNGKFLMKHRADVNLFLERLKAISTNSS